MDDPRILRVITVGLVLAVLAVVYFLFTGGFSVSKTKTTTSKATTQSEALGVASASPIASVQPKPSATPTSAYNTIAARNQANVQTLPRTGFPVAIAVLFSVYLAGSGFYLRKYSK